MRQIYNGLKRSVSQNPGVVLLLISLLTVSLIVLFLRPQHVDRIRARVPFARTSPKPPPKVSEEPKGDKMDTEDAMNTEDEMDMYDGVEGYRTKKSKGKKKATKRR